VGLFMRSEFSCLSFRDFKKEEVLQGCTQPVFWESIKGCLASFTCSFLLFCAVNTWQDVGRQSCGCRCSCVPRKPPSPSESGERGTEFRANGKRGDGSASGGRRRLWLPLLLGAGVLSCLLRKAWAGGWEPARAGAGGAALGAAAVLVTLGWIFPRF